MKGETNQIFGLKISCCKMLYLKAVYMTSQHSVMIVCDLIDLTVRKSYLKFFSWEHDLV